METMWAPWRSAYVSDPKSEEKKPTGSGCVFCDALASDDDHENYMIHRGKNVFVILNLYPYNNGHMLILPNRHVSTLEALDQETRYEMMDLITKAQKVLESVYNPHGINIGNNTGEAAGAGIAAHLHFHVLPRWTADVNFMTAIANTRVIPESLDLSWEKIRSAWKALP